MIPVTFFPLLQHHPKPQLVVPDLGSCKRREFSPQAEDAPVTVVTPHAPRRCFSSLAGEYAESPQILVLWIPIQDWETSPEMPKAIYHIKRGFRVCEEL